MELWQDPQSPEYWSNEKSFLNTEEMANPSRTSRLAAFVKYISDLGFNGLCFFGNHDHYPYEIGRFASYLKENGLGLIIIRYWNEFERGFSWPPNNDFKKGHHSIKYCPFNPELKKYWEERIAQDFKMVPGLMGYKINGTEYYANLGAPWMCECNACGKLSKKERTIAAIKLISDILKPYNGTLFWEACQDDPVGMGLEVDVFGEMTGQIPANAKIIIKETYWDYHPDWPRHAVFYTMKKDNNGNSPYLTSVQLAGEYTGIYYFPYSKVHKWSNTFRDIKKTGQEGIWAMTIAHPQMFDHPFNLVNWYAISCYMKNPWDDPDKIMMDWTASGYGGKAAEPILRIIKKLTLANRSMLYHRGLWTQDHSRFFDLAYLESHLCGPYRYTKAVEGLMGLDLTVDMYNKEKQDEIKRDGSIQGAFGRIPVTEQLKQELLEEKEMAVALIDESLEILNGLGVYLSEELFTDLQEGFSKIRNDALFWKLGMEMYLDWKLGILTEDKIDKALDKCKGLRGALMPEPLKERRGERTEPVNLAAFADELRRELREPWLRKYFETGPEVCHLKG